MEILFKFLVWASQTSVRFGITLFQLLCTALIVRGIIKLRRNDKKLQVVNYIWEALKPFGAHQNLIYNTLWLNYLLDNQHIFVDVTAENEANNWAYFMMHREENKINIPLSSNDGYKSYNEALDAGIKAALVHLRITYGVPI